MSSGKGREKIKLMGASTDVKARNVGGSPDSRRDVSDMASLAGFKGTAGTDGIGTVSMGLTHPQLQNSNVNMVR